MNTTASTTMRARSSLPTTNILIGHINETDYSSVQVQAPTKQKLQSENVQFRHSDTLLIALLPPIAILLAFGGKATLLTLGFGGLIVYIFDLLGTMEGSLLAIILTSVSIWGSLVWSARLLLFESVANIPLALLMGIIIFYVDIVMFSHYSVLRKEFEFEFYFFETLMFASVPLLSATLITWFLCVELPSLDLSLCFSLTYFCYLLYLGRPRIMSHPIPPSHAQDRKSYHLCYVLPLSVVRFLYAIPLFYSPLLAVGVKYHILHAVRLSDIAVSFLCPLLAMIVCVEQQIEYWPEAQRNEVSMPLGTVKLATATVLFACIQDSAIFDDLKAFSTLSDTLASATLCGATMFITLAVGIYRSESSPSADYITESKTSVTTLVRRLLVDVCVGASGGLFGLLLRLPPLCLPIAIVGPVALAEYYQRSSVKLDTQSRIATILLAVLASISCSAVALCYSMETVYYYSFSFVWDLYKIDLRQFCFVITALDGIAVLLPVLLYDARNSDSYERYGDWDAFLPVSNRNSPRSLPGTPRSGLSDQHAVTTAIGYFQMALSIGGSCLAAAELLIREQDWSNYSASSGSVYPPSVLIGTALLLIAATAHLHNVGAIKAWCVWSVLISQLMKLTHLVDVSPQDSFAAAAVLRSYTLPFVAQCFNYSEDDVDSEEDRVLKRGRYGVTPFLLVVYLFMAALATYYARLRIMGQLLIALTWKESGEAQHITACMSMYAAFLAAILHVFRPRQRTLRTVCIVLSLVCALLTSEALSLVVQLRPTFPYIQLSWLQAAPQETELANLASQTHTGLYIALTLILSLAALTSAFPTKRPAYRLLFAILFSGCASRALYGWNFETPLTDEGVSSFWNSPNLISIAFGFVGTFAALQISRPRTSQAAVILFVLTSLIPMVSLVVVYLVEGLVGLQQCVPGVVWSAMACHGALGLTVRVSELMRDVEVLRSMQSIDSGGQLGRESLTVSRICLLTSLLCIFWTCIGVVIAPAHANNLLMGRDGAVPLACLSLLATKRGTFTTDMHPLVWCAIAASAWWVCSALYSVLIRVDDVTDPFNGTYSVLRDGHVSLWTSPSPVQPLLHLGLTLAPLPSIFLSFLRSRAQSEEMMFMLAVVSVTSIVGSQLMSLRCLGVMGVALGFWRSSDISVKKRVSNRLI